MGEPTGPIPPPTRDPSCVVRRDEVARILKHADDNPEAALITLSVFAGVLLERCK